MNCCIAVQEVSKPNLNLVLLCRLEDAVLYYDQVIYAWNYTKVCTDRQWIQSRAQNSEHHIEPCFRHAVDRRSYRKRHHVDTSI
ncbi:hypothetical protein Mapa_007301 [Marchantia paleacea]|nr:hypothetical protein Mapa_007301 [Marchantia paleacea]